MKGEERRMSTWRREEREKSRDAVLEEASKYIRVVRAATRRRAERLTGGGPLLGQEEQELRTGWSLSTGTGQQMSG